SDTPLAGRAMPTGPITLFAVAAALAWQLWARRSESGLDVRMRFEWQSLARAKSWPATALALAATQLPGAYAISLIGISAVDSSIFDFGPTAMRSAIAVLVVGWSLSIIGMR